MREEWKAKIAEPFWPFNYDEYAGIDDYKEKIRERLKRPDKHFAVTGC